MLTSSDITFLSTQNTFIFGTHQRGMKKKIALVTGGYSGEAEISYKSAITVGNNIDTDKFDYYKIDITPTEWAYVNEENGRTAVDISDFSINKAGNKITFDAILLCIHGTPGEDGKLQGYFDMLNLPYTSCDAATSALTFNKRFTVAVAAFSGINVAKSLHLFKHTPVSVNEILASLKLPVFVKPNNGGSSLGISKVIEKGELAVAILFFFAGLGWITGHGKYDKVPTVVGQNVYAAINTLEAQGFKVEVSDSVFTTAVPGLTIMKQIPDGDAEVKHGRIVFLTVNRAVPPKIEMPSLIGFSFKSAALYLQGMGLVLGDTTYKPDFAKNAVLEQLFNNEPIKPGTQISIGSKISFVLGSGIGDSDMNMPDVVGLTLQAARTKLGVVNLSVGTVVAIGEVTDSLNAFVVRQNPAIFSEAIAGQKTINKVRQGTTVDLYISTTAPVKDSTNTYPQ